MPFTLEIWSLPPNLANRRPPAGARLFLYPGWHWFHREACTSRQRRPGGFEVVHSWRMHHSLRPPATVAAPSHQRDRHWVQANQPASTGMKTKPHD